MTLRSLNKCLFALTTLFCVALLPSLLLAQDDTGEAEQKIGEDFYEVPDGSVEELQAFIDKIRNFEPANVLEVFAHRKKAGEAITGAAEKILEKETDKESDAYKQAFLLILQVEVGSLPTASPEEQVRVFQKASDLIKQEGITEPMLALAYQTASGLEYGGNDDLAAKAYEQFGDAFAKSDNEEIARIAKGFTAAVRRLRLPGQPIKVTGKDLEGNDIDWKSFKGKVVLIDFWATWCAPCREELPHIKAVYEKYGEKGFDVVGISLDEDRVALEQYVEELDVPWTTLHEDNSEGMQPTAEYYGVSSLPTMILVGRDGNVLSTDARGENLDRLLKEQFEEKDEAAGE